MDADARGDPVDPQNLTGQFRNTDDRVQRNFHARPAHILQSTTTLTNAAESNSAQMLNCESVAQQSAHPGHLSHPTGFLPSRQPALSNHLLRASSQQSLNPERLGRPRGQDSQQPQEQNSGMFSQARDFMVTGTFIESNVTHNHLATSSRFMEMLLEKTIPGAAFDSSARDPPPRCHPGTRLAIIKRCLCFIANYSRDDAKRIRWVVGGAGVGKSAIMQTVAESPLPVASHASVFFSVQGRNDGTKTVLSLAYQFAVKSEPYRQLIEQMITCDPSLLQSSMAKQFQKFIIEPFVHHPQLSSAGHVLIIIDGLDECNNSRTQQELLRLISDFCIKYRSSPILWLIASRPETHITSFFSKHNIVPVHEVEEILVDCDRAREDVELFLRSELMEIKETFGLHSKWPDERDLWKLANASGGLFAYADTAIRYIGNLAVGNPASQLSDVLNVINNHPMTHLPREQHPMALLDALYARILANVPPKIMINTRLLLLHLASPLDMVSYFYESNFLILCNWLGLTCDDAYAALNHLRSVLRVPRRGAAHKENLKHIHKSFVDYIFDFNRSGFSSDVKHEVRQFDIQRTFATLNEAPDNIDFGDMNYTSIFGNLMRGPGSSDKISLTWPADEEADWDDNRTRLNMYRRAIGRVVVGIERGEPTFQTEFCVRLVTMRYESYGSRFPYDKLRDLVFDGPRRDTFMTQGILKTGPVMLFVLPMWCRRNRKCGSRNTILGLIDALAKDTNGNVRGKGKIRAGQPSFRRGNAILAVQYFTAIWRDQCPILNWFYSLQLGSVVWNLFVGLGLIGSGMSSRRRSGKGMEVYESVTRF